MRVSRRLATLSLATALVVGVVDAASSADATSPPPDSTEPPGSEPAADVVTVDLPPPTPWDEALDGFDPEGTGDVDAALAMLNLALGPIDGLPPPPADAGARGDITVAYRAVLGVWDQLTPDQGAAVEAVLFPPDAATAVAGFSSARPAAGDQWLADLIDKMAGEIRGSIAERIGDFDGDITTRLAPRNNADNDLGMAPARWDATGAFRGCAVTIFPSATTASVESDDEDEKNAVAHRLVNTVAHEVFHCFQQAGYGTRQAYAGAPNWVAEGGAEWVAATLVGPDDTTPGRWSKYLARPEVPLQRRSYDGLGFWAHLAESGVDPWSVFRDVWSVSGTPAAFERAGANTDAFLDTWASGFFRQPERGAAWDTSGPGIIPGSDVPNKLDVQNGAVLSNSIAPYALGLFELSGSADIVEITATGHARLSDGVIDTTELASSRHCRRPDGCACPNNPNDIPPLPLQDGAFLALTGGPDGSNVTVTGITLDQHCDDETAALTCPSGAALTEATGQPFPDPTELGPDPEFQVAMICGYDPPLGPSIIISEPGVPWPSPGEIAAGIFIEGAESQCDPSSIGVPVSVAGAAQAMVACRALPGTAPTTVVVAQAGDRIVMAVAIDDATAVAMIEVTISAVV